MMWRQGKGKRKDSFFALPSSRKSARSNRRLKKKKRGSATYFEWGKKGDRVSNKEKLPRLRGKVEKGVLWLIRSRGDFFAHKPEPWGNQAIDHIEQGSPGSVGKERQKAENPEKKGMQKKMGSFQRASAEKDGKKKKKSLSGGNDA